MVLNVEFDLNITIKIEMDEFSLKLDWAVTSEAIRTSN